MKTFCINLDRREDRWKECLLEMEKHNMEVERIPAIDGSTLDMKCKITKNEAGCSLSHAKVLRRIIDDNLDRALILEDDFCLKEGWQEVLDKTELPKYTMLYLGCNHQNRPIKIRGDLFLLRGAYTTSSYIITREAAILMLPEIEKLEKQVDVVYSRYHLMSRTCYSFNPVLCWQRASYSDIQGSFQDYKSMRKI
jgi:glycosyl transferase, family 25